MLEDLKDKQATMLFDDRVCFVKVNKSDSETGTIVGQVVGEFKENKFKATHEFLKIGGVNMSKCKFKVGDIVRGTKTKKYNITNEKMTKGEVVAVIDYGTSNDMVVKVLEHTSSGSIGCQFTVNSKYFELVESPKPEKSNVIVIYSNGNKVVAVDKTTGKEGVAKCDPRDTFDFMTGAKLAFERLTAPTYKIVKQDKYEVGDKVKIVDKWNRNTYENLNGRMDKWLGKIMTIKEIRANGYYGMEEDKRENLGFGWSWNEYCIEGKVVEETDKKPKEKPLYNGRVVCVKTGEKWFTVGKIYEIKDGKYTDDDGDVMPRLRPPFKTFEDFKKYVNSSEFIEIEE